MARYIVVEFTDNADAEAFVERINWNNQENRKLGESFTRRIVGIFVKPGRTCECSGRHKGNFGAKDWPFGIARGAKFGWWVCTNCSKPREGGHQLVNQLNLSDTYEGVIFNDYEFCVTNIEVTGIHTSQYERPKKLRRKKVKN